MMNPVTFMSPAFKSQPKSKSDFKIKDKHTFTIDKKELSPEDQKRLEEVLPEDSYTINGDDPNYFKKGKVVIKTDASEEYLRARFDFLNIKIPKSLKTEK